MTLKQAIRFVGKHYSKIYQGTCKNCKDTFFTTHPKRSKGYCSTSHSGMPKIKTICLYCKKSIIKSNWSYHQSKKHFCSQKCSGKYIRGNIHHNWKDGYIRNGYKSIRVNAKSILEHRHVMEQTLKRPLLKNEIVHHLNHNKLDNRPENLLLMNRKDHASLHQKGIPKKKKF